MNRGELAAVIGGVMLAVIAFVVVVGLLTGGPIHGVGAVCNPTNLVGVCKHP